MIIHINGWPGVGKLTVARIVAARLDARLVDNHLFVNPAAALAEHGSEHYTQIMRQLRAVMFDEMADAPNDQLYVLTDALEAGSDVAYEIFAANAELAERRRVPLLEVTIECELEENVRRLTTESREAHRKLRDAGVLRRIRDEVSLLRPDVPHRLELDTTDMPPEQAADEIVAATERLIHEET